MYKNSRIILEVCLLILFSNNIIFIDESELKLGVKAMVNLTLDYMNARKK